MAKPIRIPDTALREAGLLPRAASAPQPQLAQILAGVAAPFGDSQASLLRRLSVAAAPIRPERPRKR